MRQIKTNRRKMLKHSLSGAATLMVSPFFAKLGTAEVNQTSFTGFDGQSIVWGGVGYLPNDKAALPNIMPVIKMKTPNGAQFLNQLLGKELFAEIGKTNSFCQSINGANLCWGKTDDDGEARFGMILGIAAESIIQDSRDEVASFTFLRLISYNFIFSVTPSGGVQIIASYPIGGRVDSFKYGMDSTPLSEYYLRMFSQKSTTGESIPQQYKRLFATRPFNEIKTGLNYRVSQVKLQKKVVDYFNFDGVNAEHFTEWLGTATTVALSDGLNVSVLPFKLSDATFAMAESFDKSQELFFEIPNGDIEVEPTVLLVKVSLKDHPRDDSKFLQKLSVFLHLKITTNFGSQKEIIFKQVMFAEQFQVIFKKKEWRQADSTTVYLLTEDMLNMTTVAIKNPSKRQELIKGFRQDGKSSSRNEEIKPYIRIKLRPETAPNFEAECNAVLEYT